MKLPTVAVVAAKRCIVDQGFAIIAMQATPDSQAYAYTVGMSAKGWPEIVVTGALLFVVKANMIMGLAHRWREAGAAVVMTWEDFVTGPEPKSARLEYVPSTQKGRMPLLNAVYPDIKSFSAVQILWPDPNGKFPDNPEYSRDPAFAQEYWGVSF